MKILMIDPYYSQFLMELYRNNPGLDQLPYRQQQQRIMAEGFGVADFYSSNLNHLGHDAYEIIPNCKPLQYQWAIENGLSLHRKLMLKPYWRFKFPWFGEDWIYPILLAQIEAFRPDVVHFQDPGATDPQFLKAIRPFVRHITSQIACPIPRNADFSGYDLVLSSLPNYVSQFKSQGIPSAYFRLGFEASLINRMAPQSGPDVVFIGGFSREHAKRISFFETLARNLPLDWWGYGCENLPAGSPLRASYHGQAWGLPMYEKIRASKICLNYHIDISENYANNMRLYEVTGSGSLLVTDMKENLGELFQIGNEVVAYKNVHECIELVQYYLLHDTERTVVAQAGQKRTLSEHTYRQRMLEFEKILLDLTLPGN